MYGCFVSDISGSFWVCVLTLRWTEINFRKEKSRPILNTQIGGDKILSELIEEIDFLALGLPAAAIFVRYT
jgi:hypothetical protein